MRRSPLSLPARTFLAAALIALAFGSPASSAGSVPGRPPSPPTMLPQGLEANWTFADAASGTAQDATGNGRTATLQGGATFTQGQIGRALQLDGVDDAATIAPSTIVSGVSGAAISGWIRMDSIPADGQFREILSLSVGGAGPSNSSRLALAARGNAQGTADVFAGGRSTDTESQQTLLASASLGANSWHHVAANYSFSGDLIEIYVNGVLSASAAVDFSSDTTPATASESIAIGAQDTGSGNHWLGGIDELRVYSRTLTQAEIEELAEGLGPKLLLHFDEASGVTAVDSSSNGEDATLQGDATRIPGPMGSAVLLDGDGDYVKLMNDSRVTALVNEVTVTAWIRIDQLPADGVFQEIVSLSVNDAGGGPTATSRVAFALRGDSAGTADIWAGARTTDTTNMKSLLDDANLSAGDFVHVAAVLDFDGGFISTFVNGSLSATTPAVFEQPHTANTPGTNGAIGAQDDGQSNHLAGAVDCVRVYCKALTAAEIQRLVIRDGLKASWRADEGAGASILADDSGSGIDGTLQGDATFAAGQFGNALVLDGDGDAVVLPSDLTVFSDVVGMSFSGWLRLDSLPASGSFMELISLSVNGSPGTNSSRFALAVKGDGAAADIFLGARDTDTGSMQSTTADANLAAGTFRHVAATVDVGRDTLRIYLDGTLIHSASVAFANDRTPNTPSTNSAIGAQDAASSNFLQGALDEMRLFCRVLTPTEIAALATLAPPPPPQNLIATPGDGVVNLQWDASPGATSYNIHRSTDEVTFAIVGSTTQTMFTDSPLTNGVTYFYKVSALNAAGESVPAPDPALPATPTTGATPTAPRITSPQNGDFLNTATPTVTGTSDAPGLTITVKVDGNENGTTVSAMGGAWSLVVPNALSEGAHGITAFATNAAGDSPDSAPPVNVTIDLTDPIIDNPSPAPGSTTMDDTVPISANWSDATSGVDLDTAMIIVAGEDVTDQPSTTITATGFTHMPPAPLALGSVQVDVSISDGAGNPGSLSWSFTLEAAPPTDTTPPVMTDLFPEDGSVVLINLPTLTASFSDSGGSGIKESSVVVTLNLMAFTPPQVGVSLSDQDNGTMTFIPPGPLDDGENAFSVAVMDNAGNPAQTQSSTFTVDTVPPSIAMMDPSEGAEFTSPNVTLNATVSDEGGISDDPSAITVFVGTTDVSSSVTRTPQGGTLITLSGTVPAVPGANTLQINATDVAGRTTTEEVTFTVTVSSGVALTGITPDKAGFGAIVRLSGSNFSQSGEATKVIFSSAVEVPQSQFVSFSASEIQLRVPLGVETGPVFVTVGSEMSNSLQFELLRPFATAPLEASIIEDEFGFPVLTTDELMVQLEPNQGFDDATALAVGFGGQVLGYQAAANVYQMRFSNQSFEELTGIRDSLKANGSVVSATYRVGLLPRGQQGAVTDRRYGDARNEGRLGMWAWDRIQATAAWRILDTLNTSLSDVNVAVFEAGVFSDHVDFSVGQGLPALRTVDAAGAIVPYVNQNNTFAMGHGTATAGLIAGAANDLGIDGILGPPMRDQGRTATLFVFPAPQVATDFRFFTFWNNLQVAMERADGANVRVFSVSVGRTRAELAAAILTANPLLGPAGSTAQADSTIRDIHLQMNDTLLSLGNMLVVVNAGNEGTDISQIPDLPGSFNADVGSVPNLMVVGAIGTNDDRWNAGATNQSNFSPNTAHIDIAAPGDHVLVPWTQTTTAAGPAAHPLWRQLFDVNNPPLDVRSNLVFTMGTSFSTPLVAGSAGLLFSIDSNLTPGDVKALLMEHAFEARVVRPGTQRVMWRTLKLADTIRALLTQGGTNPNTIPSWSHVWVTRDDDTAQPAHHGTARFKTVIRSDNTYMGQDLENFFNQGEKKEFSVAADGRSLLVVDLINNGNKSQLVRAPVPAAGAPPVIFQRNQPKVGPAPGIEVNFVNQPAATPSGGSIFLSRHDMVHPDDSAQDEFWSLTDDGTETRLININATSEVWRLTFEDNSSEDREIPVPLKLDSPSVTQDEFWLLFTSFNGNDEGHLYLLLLTDDTSMLPGSATGSMSTAAKTRFHSVTLPNSGNTALTGVVRPIISPDGTRIAYINRSTGEIRFGEFALARSNTERIVLPWHITRVLCTNQVSSTEESVPFNIAWSPDGSHIVFSDGAEPVWTISAAAGEYALGPANVTITRSNVGNVPGSTGSFRWLGWGWGE